MECRNDGLEGVEVEEQLLQFQQAVDDLRDAVRQLAASPLTNSQDRQKHIFQINKLKQEVRTSKGTRGEPAYAAVRSHF